MDVADFGEAGFPVFEGSDWNCTRPPHSEWGRMLGARVRFLVKPSAELHALPVGAVRGFQAVFTRAHPRPPSLIGET
jgi:hypothetical protein